MLAEEGEIQEALFNKAGDWLGRGGGRFWWWGQSQVKKILSCEMEQAVKVVL